VLEVAAVVSSFFCAWQEVKNATVARAVINDKTDIFIGFVRLNAPECSDPAASASN